MCNVRVWQHCCTPSTMYSVQRTAYSVQCTVHSAQCTVYSVQCTVYGVHRTAVPCNPTPTPKTYSTALLYRPVCCFVRTMSNVSQLMVPDTIKDMTMLRHRDWPLPDSVPVVRSAFTAKVTLRKEEGGGGVGEGEKEGEEEEEETRDVRRRAGDLERRRGRGANGYLPYRPYSTAVSPCLGSSSSFSSSSSYLRVGPCRRVTASTDTLPLPPPTQRLREFV